MRWSVTLAVVFAAMVPAASAAQEAPRIDPEAGSPAETIYGIPLEEARREAAPKDGGGSAVRSELGVASSPRVPGGRVGRARSGPGPSGAGPKGQRRSGGESRPARPKPASSKAPAPSAAGTWSLLVLTVLLAGGAGIVAARGGLRGDR